MLGFLDVEVELVLSENKVYQVDLVLSENRVYLAGQRRSKLTDWSYCSGE